MKPRRSPTARLGERLRKRAREMIRRREAAAVEAERAAVREVEEAMARPLFWHDAGGGTHVDRTKGRTKG